VKVTKGRPPSVPQAKKPFSETNKRRVEPELASKKKTGPHNRYSLLGKNKRRPELKK